MQHYLVRLAYTAEAWQALLDAQAGLDERLDKVRRLVKELGGAFANYSFFDDPHFYDEEEKHVVICKFVPFGAHDIVCIIAMPDANAARAFQMAVSAEVGVRSIELTPMMPYEDAMKSMDMARNARVNTSYSAVGRKGA
jgi:uncharacterized protein with GYD domain